MDDINTLWEKQERIGLNTPAYDKQIFIDIENKIIQLCREYDLTCKYNVGPMTGGVPPKGDKTKIVNHEVARMAYHDVMGGILISTRNAEINSRNADTVLDTLSDDAYPNELFEYLHDKYILEDSIVNPEKIIFLPGSNLFNTVDWEKIEELMIDYPDAMIKPHPIMTQISTERLQSKWGDRLISQDVAGLPLINGTKMLWTTYNSEIGLIAALKKKEFGIVCKWNDVFSMMYAPVYRHFKYRDTEHNYKVISTFINSKMSGLVFPWQNDWEERLETYFKHIVKFEKGMEYPYDRQDIEAA